MTTFRATVSKIKKASKAGRSRRELASEYHVSKPEIGRLIAGHYPGPKIARVLGLRPRCPACKKVIAEKKVKVTPPKIGRDAGWIEYYMRIIK
jgi:hypothetical protein